MFTQEMMQAVSQDKAREASEIARAHDAQVRRRGTDAPRSGPSRNKSSFPILSFVSRIWTAAS